MLPLFVSPVFSCLFRRPEMLYAGAVISPPCLPDRLAPGLHHDAAYLPFILFGSDFVPFIILIW